MDEARVRAAVERLAASSRGTFIGTSTECRLVPVEAIAELVDALDADEPAAPSEDVPA